MTGALRPINFVFDLVRGTTGVALVKIQEEEFIKTAKEIAAETDAELFGPQDEFVEAVTRFVRSPNQKIMSASGILLFNGLVRRLLNARRSVVRYVQENREVVVAVRFSSVVALHNFSFQVLSFVVCIGQAYHRDGTSSHW